MTSQKLWVGTAILTVVGLVGCSRQGNTVANQPGMAEPALAPPTAGSSPATGSSGSISPSGVRQLDPAPVRPSSPPSVTASTAQEADDVPRTVVTKRSKKKSAAIIGGSAAAGAAIGALAGGGKGAAIGAIAGGAGGLVYDRTTAKKKKTVD